MLSTTRCAGGIARPRDLHLLARGHLERHKVESVPLSPEAPSGKVRRHSMSAHTNNSLAPQLSCTPLNACGFHTSSSASYDSTSYNVTDVPEFFVKYKQRRFSDSEAQHQDLGLMPSLTHSISMGDVVANTRRLRAKIPIEHRVPEGHVIHSSGFVVPGPGHASTSDVARAKEKERNENLDLAIQTAAVAHRVLESDLQEVDATTLPSLHKIPFEVHELDGTVRHPSGFVPPTPAHKFRHLVNTNALWDRKISVPRPKPRRPSPARGVLRAMHTAMPVEAS